MQCARTHIKMVSEWLLTAAPKKNRKVPSTNRGEKYLMPRRHRQAFAIQQQTNPPTTDIDDDDDEEEAEEEEEDDDDLMFVVRVTRNPTNA